MQSMSVQAMKNGMYFVSKIVLTYGEKKKLEKLLKFKAEGREFSKFLKSLELFIQIEKNPTNLFMEVSQI